LRQILVSNVPAQAKESDLKVFFRFHGDIKHVEYQNEERTKALIEYTKPDEAESALLFEGTTFHGCLIKVALFDQPHIPAAEPAPALSPTSFQEQLSPAFEVPILERPVPEPQYPQLDPVDRKFEEYHTQEPVSKPKQEVYAEPEADDQTLTKLTLLSPFDTANSVLVVLVYFSYLCVGSFF